ncbi:hypothetical protein [Chitinophaga arvensicola]|uniref:Uncharacterized protein n=1 Tax=Chitinophaga arvensicola TaxID=29529 RepID=A0A1I0R4E2_9BACT|nr:hypothetical protein [Chitinophaga arvensicola]SEW35150.1 hypothetical protein SAMN04488122_2189 [Chitinophaga arvensicola]
MSPAEALTTAARTYCKEHFDYWSARYVKERTGKSFPEYSYTDNDYNLFPRYNVLSAILGEVEMLTGKTWPDLEQCRETLIHIGDTASSPFTVNENNIEQNAIREERDKFIHFISTITPSELALVAPLPWRRRLPSAEQAAVRQVLLERWNYDGDYWDPLDYRCPTETIYLAKKNITANDYQAIISFISSYAAPLLLELTEDGTDAEIDINLFHPDCYETVYCDRNYEWIIYGSYESTVTFAGEALLTFIKQQFNGREELFDQWPS